MAVNLVDLVAGLHAERSDRGLGDVTTSTDLVNVQFSDGLHEAAETLATKAVRAVAAGDDERAHRYAVRAAALPFDEHEQVRPGPWEAWMVLFGTVVEAAEEADIDDSTWLDAALAVADRHEGHGREALLRALGVMAQDHDLPRQETRRIRRVLPRDVEDGPPSTEDDDEAGLILDLARVTAEYSAQLAGTPLTTAGAVR